MTNPTRTFLFFFTASLLSLSAPVHAASPDAPALAALRRALSSGAFWTMERSLPGTDRTLRSSGTVECTVGRGIEWVTLEPFPSRVSMRAEGMLFDDEDGRRFRPADSIPHYAEIREATDALASDDSNADALERAFAIETLPSPDGAWRLRLVPRDRDLREFLPSIEVTGADVPTEAVLQTRGGGSTAIHFAGAADAP